MTPKFSKALLAAGLAAALVGCGGGSNTAMTPDPGPVDPGPVDPPAPTPEQMMANIEAGKTAFDAALASAEEVIDNSSSSNEDMIAAYEDIKMAVETFSSVLRENGGHSLYQSIANREYATADSGIDRIEGNMDAMMARIEDGKKTFDSAISTANGVISKSSSTYEEKIAAYDNILTAVEDFEEVLDDNGGHTEYKELATEQETMANSGKSEAKTGIVNSHYSGIHASAFHNREAAYAGMIDSDIEVNVGDDDFTLTLNEDVELTAIATWTGEFFNSGENIGARVYSMAGQPFDEYFTLTDGSGSLDDDATDNEVGLATGVAVNTVQYVPYRPFISITEEDDEGSGGIGVTLYTDLTDNGITPIEGSFMGVEGTFYCTDTAGTQCAVRDLGNNLMALGLYTTNTTAFDSTTGAWTFVPDDVDDTVSSYASYGYWWIREGNTRTISAFHDYRGAEEAALETTNLATFDTLEDANGGNRNPGGEATYNGGAVGRYAIENVEEDQFVANVELTARFDEDLMDIQGTIDNFMTEDNGEKDWLVTLRRTDINTDGTIEEGLTRWTIDEDTIGEVGGQWMSAFRDFDTNTNAPTADVPINAPDTVTGVFSAYAPNAKMVGAFGTDLEE